MINKDANGVRPDDRGAQITVLTHGSFIGKRFDIVAGELVKTSQATFYDGEARAIAAPDADALSSILDRLKPDTDVIILGRMTDNRTSARVVKNGRQDPQKGIIARTQEHFEHAPGEGWLLLDHDTKDMPADVRARIEALGGGVEAIKSIWPELADADYLVRPSSSGGVYIEGGSPKAATGFHMFVRLADVRQSKAALEALTARAWAAGLAWHAVSKSGALLERSIIDAAVGGPERLVFTAAPLLGEGVHRKAPESIIQRGMAVSAPTMPDTDLLRLTRRESRQKLKPEAEKAEAAFTALQVDKLTAQGVARPDAERIIRDRVKGGVLADDDTLQMADGRFARVGDMLDAKFTSPGADKLSLPDPVEGVEYGKTTAAIVWGIGHDAPALVSHAHGKITVYRFARYLNDADIEARQAQGDHERAIETGDLPEAVDLPDGRRATLIEALNAADDRDDAVAIAQAVLSRWIKRTPHSMSADDLVRFITDHLPKDLLTDADIAGLRDRITRRNFMRRKAALRFVSLSTHALHDNSNVMTVDSLDSAGAMPQGVTVVKAPMSKGKTQKVAAPWIKAARKNGSVMAICHRVTLVGELSHRLDLPHYQRAKPTEILAANGIAVCLPSITTKNVQEHIAQPDFVFIDEVAQVLRFLESKDFCRTKNANVQGVFDTLVSIIRNAKGVLVADADVNDRVMQFLRYCRPHETFNVLLMHPTRQNKSATVYASNDAKGSNMRGQILDKLLLELTGGGKCWVACESAKLVADIAFVLEAKGFKTLAVTAANKTGEAQRAFLNDADGQSRLYDAVVVSPAVVSGISIEHRDRPHFTLGGSILAGFAIVPSDAAQQMVRVRYLDRFIIGLAANNAADGQTAHRILDGWEGLANIEAAPVKAGYLDHMRADIQATEENAKADFAAGLFWMLEHAGWTLETIDVDASDTAKGDLRDAKETRVDAWHAAIMAAEVPDQDTAAFLRGRPRNENEAAQLEAFDITQTLKIKAVDVAAIEIWDDGRFAGKLRRFKALTAYDHKDAPVQDELVSRRFRLAEHKLLAELFDGIDIGSSFPFNADVQTQFIDRLMHRRFELVAAGILSKRHRAEYLTKAGALRTMTRPKNFKAVLRDIGARLGLDVVDTRVRLSQNTPSLYKDIQSEGILGQQDNRVRVYGFDQETLALMAEIRDRDAPPSDVAPAEIVSLIDSPSWKRHRTKLDSLGRVALAPHRRVEAAGLPIGSRFSQVALVLHETQDKAQVARTLRLTAQQVDDALNGLYVIGLVDAHGALDGPLKVRKLVWAVGGHNPMTDAHAAQRRAPVRLMG